jgi:ribosomal protein S18 acetylase RimI-like enzyme
MGGIRPNGRGQAEVLRLRVHPATRRRCIGRRLMADLEERAAWLGFTLPTIGAAGSRGNTEH